jgi:poly(rC)-binding protein 2/3/4
MSASPTAAPTQSTKRPLEDPSSPSAPNDQPEAKRPALDKIVKGEPEETKPTVAILEPPVVSSNGDVKTESSNGTKAEVKDEQGDTVVPDAAHTIHTSSSRGGHAQGSSLQHDESGWIHIRAVITSAEAATVIGKGGENVSLIRKMSGAKCTVSDYQKGAVERILTVSGVVDAAAKVSSLFSILNKQADSSPSGIRSYYQDPKQRAA